MPKRYAREFRRASVNAWSPAKRSALSEETGVSVATLYLWKRPGPHRCRLEGRHEEHRGRRAGPGPQDH